jgi:hypothetical protein
MTDNYLTPRNQLLLASLTVSDYRRFRKALATLHTCGLDTLTASVILLDALHSRIERSSAWKNAQQRSEGLR